MKHVALCMLCTVVLLFSGQSTSAESMEEVGRMLERMTGTWYDEDGDAVLTIEGRTINGCAVVGGDRLAGGGANGALDFFVSEANGTRTLHIQWKLLGGAGDYIVLDGGEALQRTLHPACFESVSDIRFGMRMRVVQELLGEGQELNREQPYRAGEEIFAYGVYYPSEGLIVLDKSGIVTGLVLLKGSTLHFDRTGLTASDSREMYARAYDLPQIPEELSSIRQEFYCIASGEYLSFGPHGSFVKLSVDEF